MRTGALLSAAGRILVTIAGAATTVAVGRILGPPGFGIYSVATTVIVVSQALTTLGIETGIVYYVSSRQWAPQSAFFASQRVSAICGLACVVAVVLIRLLLPQAFHGLSFRLTVVASLSVPFLLSWLLGAYVALAAGNYRAFIAPSVVKEVCGLGVITLLALWKGLPGAIVGLTFANLVAAAAGFAVVGNLVRRPTGNRSEVGSQAPGMLSQALRFGIKGSAANTLQTINLRLDTLVLNAGVSTAVVGHYALAVSITGVMTIIPGALSDALFPQVAALHKGRDGLERELLLFAEQKSLRHCLIATVGAAAICVIGLLALVVPVYGSGFRPTIALGLILLPGAATLGLASIFTTTVVGRGRPDIPLRVMVIITPVTVALYLTLVPAFHAIGAAAASSFSYIATFTAMCWWYSRISGQPPIRALTPTFADIADYTDLFRRAIERLGQRVRTD